MARISQLRASAHAHMLMEAVDHMRASVCDNLVEREEAEKIAVKLEREADKWFARGLTGGDIEGYDILCEDAEITLRVKVAAFKTYPEIKAARRLIAVGDMRGAVGTIRQLLKSNVAAASVDPELVRLVRNWRPHSYNLSSEKS